MSHLNTFLKETRMALFITILGFSTLSCKSGGQGGSVEIDGIDGPNVVVEDDHLYIEVTFENIELLGGLRYPIPEYPNSHVEIAPPFDAEGLRLSAYISFDDLGGDFLTGLDPQTLPGGRPLPGVRSGKLPAVAFSIKEFNNIHIYAGNNFFGIFLPMPSLDVQYAIVTARFYLDDGTRAGNISLVGQDQNGENGGFLLLLNLKADLFKTSGVQHLFENLLDEQNWEEKVPQNQIWEAECNPEESGNIDCNS